MSPSVTLTVVVFPAPFGRADRRPRPGYGEVDALEDLHGAAAKADVNGLAQVADREVRRQPSSAHSSHLTVKPWLRLR